LQAISKDIALNELMDKFGTSVAFFVRPRSSNWENFLCCFNISSTEPGKEYGKYDRVIFFECYCIRLSAGPALITGSLDEDGVSANEAFRDEELN
jgi:hypothetical protein